MHRNVNGEDVPLTPGEEAELLAERQHYARVARRNQVARLLKEKLDAGIVFEGERFNDCGLLALQVVVADREGDRSFRVVARDTVVEMPARQVVALGLAMAQYNAEIAVHARELMEAINKADKPEAIDITDGWPNEFVDA
jgi:hypothetical protein